MPAFKRLLAAPLLPLFVAAWAPFHSKLAPTTATPPVVVVPGLGGSVLEARLTNRPAQRDCSQNSDWFTIWASVVQGAARYGCFEENLALHPNTAGHGNGSVVNYTGVEIRPRDFGGTGGIEYSNAGTYEPPIAYMAKLVDALVAEGYVRGVSLRAATNDFRGVGLPEILEAQYAALKGLVEDTYSINKGQAVHLLSHSLGGPYTTVFLNTAVTKAWKDKYIASHIMLSSPLMGTPVAIEAIVSGPMYDFVPQFLPELIVPLIRTFPSIMWMFPSVLDGIDVWGGKDTVFIETPTRNYSIANLKEVAKAVNASIIVDNWDRVNAATSSSATDAGVRVLCMFANDTKTDHSIKLKDDNFNSKGTRLSSTWGDGTVTLASLEACGRWKDVKLRRIQFGGSLAAHTEIVTNDDVIQEIIAWVQNATRPPQPSVGL